ncbi:MAG: 6-hydroxymethylpterin diphosphokinase MptE-like protein, partial [Vicinamibacterales bacterium]
MTPARTSGVEEPAAPAAPAFGARANDSARRRFAPRYLLNTLRNIPRIAASADVRALDDAFAGTPAVVVAAGPSLDRAVEWLRALPPYVVVIAVDTAARPLLEAGIEPHLVVAVDPSDLNARHLRHLPDTGRTWLVAEGSLDPGAFEWFTGRTFTFAVSDHEPWPWLAANGLSRGRLRAWGSVLTSALDLALRAGCTPIAFAGADLAYTGGRPYCRGTVYEHDWARRVAGGDSLGSIWLQTLAAKARRLAEDVHGRPVPTTSALLAFRDWIVEQSLAHPPRRFLNATGDGILRGGRIEQAPLPELAAQLGAGPAAPADPRAIVRDAWHRGRSMTGDSLARARAALAGLAGAADGAEPLATWRRFAGPDLPESTLRQALAAASAGIATRPDRTGVGPTIQAAGAPERAEALRAAMSREVASPVAGAGASAFPPGVPDAAGSVGEAALADARSRLVTLVASAGRLTRSDAEASPASVAGTAAVHAHAWTAAATPLVLAYEAALAALLRNPRGNVPEAWIRVSLDPPAPRTLDGPDPAADAPAELAARLGLIADGLAISAAMTAAERAPGATTAGHLAPSVAAALLRAYVAGIASSSRQPPATGAPDIPTALVSVALAGRRFTCRCAIAARDAVVARTGLLVRSRVENVNDSRQPSPLPALSVTLAGPGPGDGLTLSLSVAFASAGT